MKKNYKLYVMGAAIGAMCRGCCDDSTAVQPNRNSIVVQPIPQSPSFDMEQLREPCSAFSLVGKVHFGYCIDAYDGDTCTINICSSIGTHKWKIRMAEMDAPELKTHDDVERRHATACKNILLDLIHKKYVVIVCDKFDKYGRLLGWVYVRSVVNTDHAIQTQSCEPDDINRTNDLLNVNTWMLENTPCVYYVGKHKEPITYDKPYHPCYLNHLAHCC